MRVFVCVSPGPSLHAISCLRVYGHLETLYLEQMPSCSDAGAMTRVDFRFRYQCFQQPALDFCHLSRMHRARQTGQLEVKSLLISICVARHLKSVRYQAV